DGTITVAFDEPGFTFTLSEYSIEWYRGTHTTVPAGGTANDDFIADDATAAGTNSGNANAGTAIIPAGGDVTQLEGLETGTYTVFITKDGVASPNEGCDAFATF
ncbi:MAG: hypothetical protein RLP14_10460, partial [Owenweeksia sp.]